MLSTFKNITSYKKGIWSEYYCAFILMLKGYRILALRYKTKVGEVDVIARRGKVLAFVEVKCRETTEAGAEAVSSHSQNRIKRAAEHFLLGKPYESPILRFDVFIVCSIFSVRHIYNAF